MGEKQGNRVAERHGRLCREIEGVGAIVGKILNQGLGEKKEVGEEGSRKVGKFEILRTVKKRSHSGRRRIE